MTDENTTEVEETVAAPEGEAVEEQATATPGLSIGDMVVLKQCVEVASARGGFRANEMQVVGTTYNKLAAFVQAALPQEEAAEADGEEAVAEEA
jgi:hypothetical protein